ncbi:MAG: alpha-glucosidase, partial [Bacteroidetes bacterium SW_11_45_7]
MTILLHLHLLLLFIVLFPLATSAQSPPEIVRGEESWRITIDDKTALTFSPNAFLTAHIEKEKVKSGFGSYTFKQNVKTRYKNPSVDSIVHVGKETKMYGQLHHKQKKVHFDLTLVRENNSKLRFACYVDHPQINRVIFRFQRRMDEQYSHVNLTGHRVPALVEEQGIGRGDQSTSFWTGIVGAAGDAFTSYAPIPFFLTTEGRAVFLENTRPSVCDFSQEGQVVLEVQHNSLKGLVWLKDDPLALLRSYTVHAGRMRSLPDWAYGTWLGVQGGAKRVRSIVDSTLASGNPVKAVWIQDWTGNRDVAVGNRLWWNWQPDTNAYPDLERFCKRMNERGVHVLGYINAFIAEGTKRAQEAIDKGYLVLNPKGEPYLLKQGGFKAYTVDLTNPDARKWYKGIIKRQMVDKGFSGWMADFGEWLPMDAQLASGISAKEYHNRFPVEWARLNREVLEEAEQSEDMVFFTRSGFSHSPKHSTLFWAGDQTVDYGRHDGMPSAVAAMLSSGMSGITLNHSDIGGYTSIKALLLNKTRDRDLFYRWAEMNAFTPVFRTHEGLHPEANFQYYNDSSAQQFFARLGRIHHRLKDFFQELTEEASQKGWPV